MKRAVLRGLGFAGLTVMAGLLFSAQVPWAQESGLETDPGVSTEAAEETVVPYAPGEYAALPDEEKRNVYFNHPELLPEEFDPTPFAAVLHAQDPVQ